MADINFRSLQKADLPLLHDWLNRPHLRDFYQKEAISRKEVEDKFVPRIEGKKPTHDHVAMCDGQALGKLQCYRLADYPEYAIEIGVTEGIGIDFFIAEPALLGHGLSKNMLRRYLLDIAFPLFPVEKKCFVCHDAKNTIAFKCSQSAGFIFLRDVMEQGALCKLLIFNRPNATRA